METLETLSDLLETTGDIQSIVRTMKSLSAVSIRQYEQAAKAMSDYEETIDLGFAAVIRDRLARGLPLPRAADSGLETEVLIVIGSDRGLCGRYNEIIARHAADSMTERTVGLIVIGARTAARLDASGRPADRLFLLPGSAAGVGTLVQSVLVEIERWTRDPGVGRIRLVHNRRKDKARAAPVEHTLLPLPESYLARLSFMRWPGPGLPFFRMEPDRLLSWLVRQRLFVVLYKALAEALTSEHATRLAAMQSAERNIRERRDDLNAAYRRKRQETITRELLDIVSGFEAVTTGEIE
jgi:F-type H+-transporting ATPase subunit gamma